MAKERDEKQAFGALIGLITAWDDVEKANKENSSARQKYDDLFQKFLENYGHLCIDRDFRESLLKNFSGETKPLADLAKSILHQVEDNYTRVLNSLIRVISAKSNDKILRVPRTPGSQARIYNNRFQNNLHQYGHLYASRAFCDNILEKYKKYSFDPGSGEVAISVINQVKEEYPDWVQFQSDQQKIPLRSASQKSYDAKKVTVPQKLLNDFARLIKLRTNAQKNHEGDFDQQYDNALIKFVRDNDDFLSKNGFSAIVGKVIGNVDRTEFGINRVLPALKAAITGVKQDCAELKRKEIIYVDFTHLIQLYNLSKIENTVQSEYTKALDAFSKKHGDYISKQGFEQIGKKLLENLPKVNQEWMDKKRMDTKHSIEAVKDDYNHLEVKRVTPNTLKH